MDIHQSHNLLHCTYLLRYDLSLCTCLLHCTHLLLCNYPSLLVATCGTAPVCCATVCRSAPVCCTAHICCSATIRRYLSLLVALHLFVALQLVATCLSCCYLLHCAYLLRYTSLQVVAMCCSAPICCATSCCTAPIRCATCCCTKLLFKGASRPNYPVSTGYRLSQVARSSDRVQAKRPVSTGRFYREAAWRLAALPFARPTTP
jgi:hypothetical protein